MDTSDGEYEVLLSIEAAKIYAGYLPRKKYNHAMDWLSIHRVKALVIFYELNIDLK